MKLDESFFGIKAQHYTILTPKLRKESVSEHSLTHATSYLHWFWRRDG